MAVEGGGAGDMQVGTAERDKLKVNLVVLANDRRQCLIRAHMQLLIPQVYNEYMQINDKTQQITQIK